MDEEDFFLKVPKDEAGVKGSKRSYWVLYLPYRGFSQTCCRLWTGSLGRNGDEQRE